VEETFPEVKVELKEAKISEMISEEKKVVMKVELI